MKMANLCPDIEELERYVVEGASSLEAHVRSCDDCRRIVEEIRDNLSVLDGIRRAMQSANQAMPGRIGGFRIIRVLGRGGMGVVYEAEQEHPRRRVALKVISGSCASPEARRRFERESLALARLSHPGIAQVHQAGTAETPHGPCPYFAMELVQGLPLLEHADQHGLSVRDRLELLAKVCDAVHHAHEQRVIHRDLKPANILVEARERVEPSCGSSGSSSSRSLVREDQPKVLDFGVSRLLEDDAVQASLRTQTGQLLGTAPYMSPEQIAPTSAPIDARSDVYALGVILFELLTGRLPYDLVSRNMTEIIRAINEEEPTRLGSVNKQLRGDVETIVGRALEKEPNRRYASAADLAADIRRFLANQPINARPPSAMYQLRKFARRNRALVAGVAAVFVVLLAGAVVSAWQAVRATQGWALAQRETQKARAAMEFLRDALASADPAAGPARPDLTVRELLDRAAARVDAGDLADRPEIELATRMTIGNAYRGLADLDAAQAQLRRAVEIGRSVYPSGHEDLAWALNKLGRTVAEKGDLSQADALFRESLAMRRALLGEMHQDVATSLNNLAHNLFEQSRYAEAAQMHRQALELRQRLLGDSHPDVATSLNNLAVVLFRMGELDQAEALLRESLDVERRARNGEDHPNLAATMDNLATLARLGGRLDEAERLTRESLAMRQRFYPDGHPTVAIGLNNLALLLRDQGKPGEAVDSLRQALALNERLLGSDHPAVAINLLNLGNLLAGLGEFDAAADRLARSWEIFSKQLGPKHPDALRTVDALVRLFESQGREEEAAIWRDRR